MRLLERADDLSGGPARPDRRHGPAGHDEATGAVLAMTWGCRMDFAMWWMKQMSSTRSTNATASGTVIERCGTTSHVGHL